MRLTLLEILEATGGGEVGGTQVGERFATYHTDSREVQPGGIFFALRGAEMDGHRFARDAVEHGAAAIVVGSRGHSGIRARLEGSTSKALLKHATCPVIVVHDVVDDAGLDEKILAVPVPKLTKRYAHVTNYTDLPEITLAQI